MLFLEKVTKGELLYNLLGSVFRRSLGWGRSSRWRLERTAAREPVVGEESNRQEHPEEENSEARARCRKAKIRLTSGRTSSL